MPFRIIRNDITKTEADAIVNTANPRPAIGGGVDHAIYMAAGWERLLQERKKIGHLAPGEAAVTDAFDLPAKYIIHSSGPVWIDGSHNEAKLLRQCYDRSLELARSRGCTSIAFPLMATGVYGFPKELGLQIATDSFRDFLKKYEMDITLAVFAGYAYKLSEALFDDIRSFIDDRYVMSALDREYECDEAELFPDEDPDDFCEEEFNDADTHRRDRRSLMSEICSFPGSRPLGESAVPRRPKSDRKGAAKAAPLPDQMFSECAVPELSLDDILRSMYTDSFEKHLQQMINKKGMKNSDVYTNANLSKQYFSKLLNGKVAPSKNKVLALAVSLRLNMDEMITFLALAGYALSPVSHTDVIVEYFIRKGNYDMFAINIALFDYGLPSLSD